MRAQMGGLIARGERSAHALLRLSTREMTSIESARDSELGRAWGSQISAAGAPFL